MLPGIAASALLLAVTPTVSGAACAVDMESMLRLSPVAFDKDLAGGWRLLGRRPECAEATANLIAAYRKAHWGGLTPSEVHMSYWHEAQLRAASGETQKALPLFLAGANPDDFGGFDYAIATVAFLQHDLASLKAARARLALIPKPEGFDDAAAKYRATYSEEVRWPPNLDAVDGFIACFDKPYRVAYEIACRPK